MFVWYYICLGILYIWEKIYILKAKINSYEMFLRIYADIFVSCDL